jgi:hypothetical protein
MSAANLRYSLQNQGTELSKLLSLIRAGKLDSAVINAQLKDPRDRKIAKKIAGKKVALNDEEQAYCDAVERLAGVQNHT